MIDKIKGWFSKSDEQKHEEELKARAQALVQQEVEEAKLKAYAEQYKQKELAKVQQGTGADKFKAGLGKLADGAGKFIDKIQPEAKLEKMLGRKSAGSDGKQRQKSDNQFDFESKIKRGL